MSQPEFYMLYVEGGESPTYKHSTPEDAKREAERLARHTGKRVHVLAAVASVLKTDLQWTGKDLDDDGIPF